MKVSKIWIALFLLPPSLATSQATSKPRFEFRGLQFGDSIPAEKGMFQSNGLKCVSNDDIPSLRECKDKGFEIVGVRMGAPIRGYLDGRLFKYYITFNSDAYATIREALISKYGPPDTSYVEQLHNRMGAIFENENLEWRFSDGSMLLERYGSRVTDGNIFAISNSGSDEWEKRRKAIAAQKAAADLGPPVKH